MTAVPWPDVSIWLQFTCAVQRRGNRNFQRASGRR